MAGLSAHRSVSSARLMFSLAERGATELGECNNGNIATPDSRIFGTTSGQPKPVSDRTEECGVDTRVVRRSESPKNSSFDLQPNSSIESDVEETQDFIEPVRRVHPEAYRRLLRTRRRAHLVQTYLRRTLSPKPLKSVTTADATSVAGDITKTDSNLSCDSLSPNSITLSPLSSSNPFRQTRNARDAYLALPVDIRYPFNYVADLFEDASPLSPNHEE
ncbi:unnamed protein product [Calicophoron daubneyi]|uniref:Uncharacterized protein n=1 Tax=Calicophoron daubneyi TaxID=300641 RepID=A0AAV2TS53_CALDB